MAGTPGARASEPGPREVRVLIAVPSRLFRQGLRCLLAALPGVRVVGEADTARAALRAAALVRPDVAILDAELLGPNRTPLLSGMREAAPETSTLVLGGVANEAGAAVEGAAGYLPALASAGELAAAVEAVASGRRYDGGAERPARAAGYRPEPPLSVRERAMLGLIARGLSNRQVADALGVTERTARNSSSTLYGKIRVGNRTQAAMFALRHGMAPPPAELGQRAAGRTY